MSVINYPVTFNNNRIDNVTGVTVLSNDAYKPPKRKISIAQIARTNKGKANSVFYEQRTISVRVAVNRTTRDLAESSLDSLMKILQGLEKELIVNQSGSTRKYYCTLSDVSVDVSGGSYMELTLVFECSEKYGYDIGSTTALSFGAYLSGSRSDPLTFDGSADWQQPVIGITLGAVTGGTGAQMVIGNDAVGETMTITRNWTAGDQLVIDSFNKTVKVNGTEVDFVGAFPEWQQGSGYWTYTDNFTTRSISGTITYVKRWV